MNATEQDPAVEDREEEIKLTPEQQELAASDDSLRLLKWFLGKFPGYVRLLGWDAAESAARWGICLAARTWDPKRGKWSTWATWYMRSCCQRDCYKLKPRRAIRLVTQRDEAISALPSRQGAEPAEAVPSRATAILREAMAKLTPREQQAIEGVYFRGVSESVIAREWGRRRWSVASAVKTGLARLRRILTEE